MTEIIKDEADKMPVGQRLTLIKEVEKDSYEVTASFQKEPEENFGFVALNYHAERFHGNFLVTKIIEKRPQQVQRGFVGKPPTFIRCIVELVSVIRPFAVI